MKYPLAKPFIGRSEEHAILEVLRSGNLSLGPKYQEFEKKFAKKIGVKYACAVSSGTAGLHLTMIAAGIGPGDEVITTPFSFVASANCILYVGAKPVFVDIDPLVYNIDPARIEKRISARTKAILVVHIFGQAADMAPIMKIASKYKLKVIEDACESINAEYKKQKVGTFGESAVFAFYPNKQMTTGEGGMIVTNNKKIYTLCASLRNQGRADKDMRWLEHNRLGYNYRMDELSASLGIVQLAKLDPMIAERKKIAGMYNRFLAGHTDLVVAPSEKEGNTHTWFVYVVRIKGSRADRNNILNVLNQEGISAKPYLPSIHLFDFYKKGFGYKKGDFPISEMVSDTAIALPFYIGLKEKDVRYICGEFVKIIQTTRPKSATFMPIMRIADKTQTLT